MDSSMLTKRIFTAYFEQANSKCKTWFYRVTQFLVGVDHQHICQDVKVKSVLASVDAELKNVYELQWKEKLNTDVAARGIVHGGNKLRTYRTFKHNYVTEQYVHIIMHKRYRSAYAKFRCGVAPIKIETCRYGLNRLPVDERLCERCHIIEDEFHVVMLCTLYTDIRCTMFRAICNITVDFTDLPIEDQFTQLMSNPLYYENVSNALFNILRERNLMYFH